MIDHLNLPTIALRERSARPVPVAAGLMAGGAAIIGGVLLPWLTLFAGLQSYNGLSGRNGRVILAGGVIAIFLGVAAFRRVSRALLATSAALGAAMSAFAAWLVAGLLDTVGAYAHSSMTLAHAGPGLFVVLAGTMIVAASAVGGLMREHATR